MDVRRCFKTHSPQTGAILFCVITLITSHFALSSDAESEKSPKSGLQQQVTECYTANGADYEGNQRQVESPTSHPTNFTTCLAWNATGYQEFANLAENFCRNPNGSVFPWCFARGDDGSVVSRLCDIPTCKTPAYVGCFRQFVPQPNGNDTQLMNGRHTQLESSRMRIARCLNYCRSRKYNYAGLTAGHSCFCSRWSSFQKMERALSEQNRLPELRCREEPCANDPKHSCGGNGAVAVYDTRAGACKGLFHNEQHGTIYSPRWPGKYQHNSTCKWEVFVPKGSSAVVFSFVYFDLQPRKDNLTFYTFRNFYDRNPVQVASFRGRRLPKDLTVVNVSIISIQFQSDESRARQGFTVNFRVIPNGADPITAVQATTEIQQNDTTSMGLPSTPQGPSTTRATASERQATSSSVVTTTQETPPSKVSPAEGTHPSSENTAATGVPTAVGSNNHDATSKNASTTKPSDNQGNTAPSKSSTEVIVIGVACALVVAITAIGVVTMELKRRRRKNKKLPKDPKPPADFKNPVTFNNGSKTVSIA